VTDNGTGFRSGRYAKALRLLKIKHLRTKPYTPKTNAKPSASSKPRCANGPTLKPNSRQITAPARLVAPI